MNLLREQELSVFSLTEILDIKQPKISRHLAYLRKAGIVSARREGKWIYYRIAEPDDKHAARILRETLLWIESIEQMQNDYEKLLLISKLETQENDLAYQQHQNILPQPHNSLRRKEEIETYLL